MPNVTVTVPMDLKKQMEKFDEVNWSAVARNAFAEKVTAISVLEKLSAKSKLTEAAALSLGRSVSKSLWDRHYKKRV